ncbi:MAG TPA: NADPH:quinone reductase [Bordetella sp.]
MQAAWYARNGKAQEVLELGELPTPEPGPGEVRVRLAASGVNPSDVKSRAGSRPVPPGTLVVPHSDGAGIIDKVGDGVPAGRVGERVWIWNGQWQRPMGTCAQFIALPAGQAVPLPESVSFEAGACLGIPALTAIHAVERLGELAGKTVLVTGAASGVGYYAAQMARLKGARVIGTVGSPDKAQALADAGIDALIHYKTEPVAERILSLTGGAGVDGIVDLDFSTTARLVPAGAVARHGVFVCYGSNDRGATPIEFGSWLPRSISLAFFLVYDLLPAERRHALDALSALLAGGKLRHLLAPAYALADIVAAHQAVESGHVLGNVTVRLPAA